jgi:hypothetical protein
MSGPFTALAEYGEAKPLQPMTATFDKTDVNIRLEQETYKVDQMKLLMAARDRLAASPQTNAPVPVEIAPGVSLLIDQIYGNLSGPRPLGNLRFWIIRQPKP